MPAYQAQKLMLIFLYQSFKGNLIAVLALADKRAILQV